MSYAEMRKALEAVVKDIETVTDYNLSMDTQKQVYDALKSEPTTAELVSELRKRDGVEVVDVPESGQSNILAWSSCTPLNYTDLIHDNEKNGKATILRITNLTGVKK